MKKFLKALMMTMLIFTLILPVNASTSNRSDLELNDTQTENSAGTEGGSTESKSQRRRKQREKKRLEGLDEMSQEEKDENERTAEAVGDLFKVGRVTSDSVEEANMRIQPIAEIVNLIIGIMLGLTLLGIGLVTALDMVYISIPKLRDFLDGGGQGTQQGRGQGMGMGGYGRGGYGAGMGMGMGMGGNNYSPSPQNAGGGIAAVGRYISDEALASVMEAQATNADGMSGRGVRKSTLSIYMKKRAYFLILFGICAVLFTTTVFTNLGVRLGTWIMRMLMGIGG